MLDTLAQRRGRAGQGGAAMRARAPRLVRFFPRWSTWLAAACACLVANIAGQAWALAPGPFELARNRMVDEEIAGAGIKDPRVLAAMRRVPRHLFVPLAERRRAYLDMALPIGHRQTISPPFIVALMTQALDPRPNDKVLEIGTGSGYQAAVLSGLVREVYTIEIVPELGRRAAETLKRLGYHNVHVKVGDGFQGWPENAPFDKIIVTCSPEQVPAPLVAQLREGGRMVIPVGERYQQTLYVMRKTGGKLESEALEPTLFVPMTGRAETVRRVLPDPSRPELVNGSFEQAEGDPPQPSGWHYQRQCRLVVADDAPDGEHYLLFTNADPGRGCQALQGLAVDGRRVRRLVLECAVRGSNLRPGPSPNLVPLVDIDFYDQRRAVIGQGFVGPWRGTFEWQRERVVIPVPLLAREAIVRIGLFGATGEMALDDIRLEAAPGSIPGEARD